MIISLNTSIPLQKQAELRLHLPGPTQSSEFKSTWQRKHGRDAPGAIEHIKGVPRAGQARAEHKDQDAGSGIPAAEEREKERRRGEIRRGDRGGARARAPRIYAAIKAGPRGRTLQPA